jgi:hypothetical protein
MCYVGLMFGGVCSKAASDAVIYDSVRYGIINAQNGYSVSTTKPAIHPSRMLHLRGNTAMMPSVIPVVRLVIQPALRALQLTKVLIARSQDTPPSPVQTIKAENITLLAIHV